MYSYEFFNPKSVSILRMYTICWNNGTIIRSRFHFTCLKCRYWGEWTLVIQYWFSSAIFDTWIVNWVRTQMVFFFSRCSERVRNWRSFCNVRDVFFCFTKLKWSPLKINLRSFHSKNWVICEICEPCERPCQSCGSLKQSHYPKYIKTE